MCRVAVGGGVAGGGHAAEPQSGAAGSVGAGGWWVGGVTEPHVCLRPNRTELIVHDCDVSFSS